MSLQVTITSKLNAIGINTSPNTSGENIAKELERKVYAIRFYMSEGCPKLAEGVIADSTWGKPLLDIVKELAA
jgi:hypothetical protein